MSSEHNHDEMQRRTAACVNAFEGIPTERIVGKNLGEILAGEMRLHGAGPRADGGFGFEFSGGVCQLLAEAYAEQFRQSGAINYLELLFQHSEIGPLTITMQRVEGLTPAQKLSQAEAQRDALAAEVSAIREQAEEVYAAGYNHGHLNTVDGIAYAPPVKDEFYHNALQVMLEVDTPATDAYLNSVRAEGVDDLATFAGEQYQQHVGDKAQQKKWKSIVFLCTQFATQLRAGKDGE